MKPEEQRIAIAEVCGWKLTPCAQNPNQSTWQYGGATIEIPDYLNDLNAMHEAEKVLSRAQRVAFVSALCGVVGLTWRPTSHFDTIHATAAQRAEAFLKTLNKWKVK